MRMPTPPTALLRALVVPSTSAVTVRAASSPLVRHFSRASTPSNNSLRLGIDRFTSRSPPGASVPVAHTQKVLVPLPRVWLSARFKSSTAAQEIKEQEQPIQEPPPAEAPAVVAKAKEKVSLGEVRRLMTLARPEANVIAISVGLVSFCFSPPGARHQDCPRLTPAICS